MRLKLIIAAMVLLYAPASGWCQAPDCEIFKREYEPQSTPEETLKLEMEMMKQGAYCYDIRIFDKNWQSKAALNSFDKEEFKTIASYFDLPTETFQEGDRAIVYYPDDITLGPVFLFLEDGKWILDRSSVYEYIHYEDFWLAYDGDYPYLKLLKQIFPMEEGVTDKGQKFFKAHLDETVYIDGKIPAQQVR